MTKCNNDEREEEKVNSLFMLCVNHNGDDKNDDNKDDDTQEAVQKALLKDDPEDSKVGVSDRKFFLDRLVCH